MPSAKSIAFLYNPVSLVRDSFVLESAAEALAVKLSLVEARHAEDFDAAFTTMANARLDAVLVSADALMLQSPNRATLVRLAARHRLPATYPILGIRRSRRIDELWNELFGSISSGRRLCGTCAERREAGQPASAAGHKARTRHQHHDGKGARLTIPPALVARADELIE
jgi:putative tryptophan/tyrosine transport system substrate-binding protein